MSHNHDDHLPDWLFGKSPFLRGLVANATNKSQQQVAETTKGLLMMVPVCVFGWWTSANIILPYYQQFTGMETGFLLFLVVKVLTLSFLPLAGLTGIIAIIHAVWYARKRWKAQPSAQTDADSPAISPDSEPSTNSERGDSEW